MDETVLENFIEIKKYWEQRLKDLIEDNPIDHVVKKEIEIEAVIRHIALYTLIVEKLKNKRIPVALPSEKKEIEDSLYEKYGINKKEIKDFCQNFRDSKINRCQEILKRKESGRNA